jgi:hypothetical protein
MSTQEKVKQSGERVLAALYGGKHVSLDGLPILFCPWVHSEVDKVSECKGDWSTNRCSCRKNGLKCTNACGECRGDTCYNTPVVPADLMTMIYELKLKGKSLLEQNRLVFLHELSEKDKKCKNSLKQGATSRHDVVLRHCDVISWWQCFFSVVWYHIPICW